MTNELTEMIHEAAYEAVKRSPLWHTLQNDAIDKKADELASAIQHFIDYWFESEPMQVRSETEVWTGATFQVEHPQLRSLSEVQSEREESEVA